MRTDKLIRWKNQSTHLKVCLVILLGFWISHTLSFYGFRLTDGEGPCLNP